VIALTREAAKQVTDLESHYEALDRVAAVHNLLLAIEGAKARIANSPTIGLPAPRPYPELKKLGRLWLKAGRYWISYSTTIPPVITGVFFETVDIPRHIEAPRE